MITAALFDFGGVITTSPFESFARYEREAGLPEGFIRKLNSTNPDANAWAKLERSQVNVVEFCRLYEQEARAAGHELDAQRVLGCLGGDVRPEMVRAVGILKERGLRTACLTNNFVPVGEAAARRSERRAAGPHGDVYAMFEVIVESSKVGVRKPDPEFYTIACDMVGIEPQHAVFLDDLGVNLKPARALGMTTIKVVDADQALAELEAAVGFPVR